MLVPFVGMICIFGFNFPPRGWAYCNGQILSLQQNTQLFALIGTYYGGDGQTTFALPDLRGRAPVSQENASGAVGMQEGVPNGTLLLSNLPAHNHLVNASSAAGDTAAPAGAFRANTGVFDKEYRTTVTAPTTVQMNASMVGYTGSNTAFSIIQPSLSLNYCIAMEGVYPQFD
ncbi:MAG TPA: tail fiber protein [Niabella sp.]|nr:tail fiber protein [Niabella sp.]